MKSNSKNAKTLELAANSSAQKHKYLFHMKVDGKVNFLEIKLKFQESERKRKRGEEKRTSRKWSERWGKRKQESYRSRSSWIFSSACKSAVVAEERDFSSASPFAHRRRRWWWRRRRWIRLRRSSSDSPFFHRRKLPFANAFPWPRLFCVIRSFPITAIYIRAPIPRFQKTVKLKIENANGNWKINN